MVEAQILKLRVRCPEAAAPSPQHRGRPPPAKRQRTRANPPPASPAGGCEWEGQLDALEQHRGECPCVAVPCPAACGADVPRGQVEAHRAACPKRKEACPHCRTLILASNLNAHIAQTCPAFEVDCVCGAKFPRRAVSSHQESDCPVQPVECPYLQQGCSAKPQRGHLQQHLMGCAVEHAKLSAQCSAVSARALRALKDEVQGLRALKDEMQALKDEVQGLKRENLALSDRQSRSAVAQQSLSSRIEEATAWKYRNSIDVTWTVKGFAASLRCGASVRSAIFCIQDCQFFLTIKVDARKEHLRIFLNHAGGSKPMPICLDGSSITLKDQSGSSDVTYRLDWQIQYKAGYRQGRGRDFARIAELSTLGLLKNDQLEIAATVSVGTAVQRL